MKNAILGLWAETSIHAGASASAGVVDLPIQREAHTGWPVVYGSGVKGAFRTGAQMRHELSVAAQSFPWVEEVFGPAHAGGSRTGTGNTGNQASDHAGALVVTDARLLLLPVRSLTSHFKWVTCPALLRRAVADCDRLRIVLDDEVRTLVETLTTQLSGEATSGIAFVDSKNGDATQTPPAPRDAAQNRRETAGAAHAVQLEQVKKLFLEELAFTEQGENLQPLIEFLLCFMSGHQALDKMLKAQLVVVNNDDFAYLCQFATPVTAHIAIDSKQKRVKDGALWYEETLPPETVLYVGLTAFSSRRKGSETPADVILSYICDDLFGERPYLQIGGNETVGMGWCKVRWFANDTETAPAANSNFETDLKGGEEQ